MPKRKDPPTEMSSESIAPGPRHSKLSESESTDTSDAAGTPESSDAAQKAKERAERWKVLKGRAVTTPPLPLYIPY